MPECSSSTSMMTSSIGSSRWRGDRIDLEHDARARHGELEAFAAHGLDQDAELQLAAAGHLVGVLGLGLLGDADGDVALGFLEQPVADDAALHLVALLAGERPVVDAEHHGERRRVDRLGEKRLVDGGVAQRVGDRRLGDAGDGDDVAGLGEIDGRALQAAEGQHLGDARGLDQRAVAAHGLDGLVGLDAARADAARQDAPEIGIGLQRGGEQAEGAVLHDRRRHVLEHQLEQRHQVGLRARGVDRHPAVAARAVEHGEVELLVGGVEVGEQIEDLVQHRVVALVGPVDLVDDDDRAQALLERLGDDELGLRQRSLGGVHQHDGAVDHVEDALHLAAEVGVAGRVDDVDARVVPEDRRALGQDGDAALALQVVAVHGLGLHLLVEAEGAGLLEQRVDQRGLAVIDVRDDRDVAKFHLSPLGIEALLHRGNGASRCCAAPIRARGSTVRVAPPATRRRSTVLATVAWHAKPTAAVPKRNASGKLLAMFERSKIENVPDLTAMPVEAVFADGTMVRGKLLVPTTKTMGDVLNGPGAFLEFEPYGGERSYIAKAQIGVHQDAGRAEAAQPQCAAARTSMASIRSRCWAWRRARRARRSARPISRSPRSTIPTATPRPSCRPR